MPTVPLWAWLPENDMPVHAADLNVEPAASRVRYSPEYLARRDALALAPVELRFSRKAAGVGINSSDGLPGAVRDAKPAGYGADRLVAQAGIELSPLELLERGVPDGVGAIEACVDIERKLSWQPRGLDDLKPLVQELDAGAPSSRALRQLNDDLATSAGGERPKATIVHDGCLACQDAGSRRPSGFAGAGVCHDGTGQDGRPEHRTSGVAHFRRPSGFAGQAL